MTDETWNDAPYYLLSLAVHRSRRYHSKMQYFNQSINDTFSALNAVLGAGAFMSLIGGDGTMIAKILIGTVALFSAVDSVVGFGKKAAIYGELAGKFTELAAKMEIWAATPDNLQLAKAERLRIEKDEPPIKRLIDLEARNEEMRSRGYGADQMVPLSKWQRRFGYIMTFGLGRLEKWDDAKPA